jgi:hypothetical protein
LAEVHIGHGSCRGQPWGRPGMLIGNGRQTTTITYVGVDVTGIKGPLQMHRDLFEVFT